MLSAGNTLSDPVSIITIDNRLKSPVEETPVTHSKYTIKVFRTHSMLVSNLLSEIKGTIGILSSATSLDEIEDLLAFHRHSRKAISIPGNIPYYSFYQSNVRFPSSPRLGAQVSPFLTGTYVNFDRLASSRTNYSKYHDARWYLARAMRKLGYDATETPGDKLFWYFLSLGVTESDVSIRETETKNSMTKTVLKAYDEFNKVYRGSSHMELFDPQL